jgi:hypothetical protein
VYGPRQSPYPPPNRGDYAAFLAIKKELEKRLSNFELITLSLKFDVFSEELIEEINNRASMLIIGGGGLYSPKPCESGWYLNCPTRLLEKIQVPIVLAGLGYNQALQKVDSNHDPLQSFCGDAIMSIRTIHNLAAMSSVRDPYTLRLLESMQAKCKTGIQILPDPATFLLNNPDPFDDMKNCIGVNLACHGNYLRDRLPSIVRSVSEFLKTEELRNYKIIFISHAPEDTFISGLLCEQGVPIDRVIDTHDFSELESSLRECRLVLTHKMHVSILAGLGLGIPFISLNYDIKQTNYLDFLDYNIAGLDTSTNEFNTQSLIQTYHQLNSLGLINISNKLQSFKQKHEHWHSLFYDQVAKLCHSENLS